MSYERNEIVRWDTEAMKPYMIDDAVSRETVSRRACLKSSAASVSTIFLGMIVGKATSLVARAVTKHEEAVRIVAPSRPMVLPGFLAAKLKWEYSPGEAPHNIILTVATKHDPKKSGCACHTPWGCDNVCFAAGPEGNLRMAVAARR
jgi:hypothetical protein